MSRSVSRARSNLLASESVLTHFLLGSLQFSLPIYSTPHESVPITTDPASASHASKLSTRSGPPPTHWSQHLHAPEDDRVIGHHVADHVTDAQPRTTQAASSAGHLLGLPGSWGFQPSFLSFCQHTSCC